MWGCGAQRTFMVGWSGCCVFTDYPWWVNVHPRRMVWGDESMIQKFGFWG